ncbi:MAG: 26S proteasome regulatory subunit rpn6 [Watsoniomyces obsoletus]|nr:MAG: 26S proteasome regulatory subunit rpn6 [Watsoniomyces obsoletus]
MGIKGLFNEIGPGQRISLARLSAEKFEETGRPFRLAIDASIWSFQTQSGQGGKNPALRTFFFRLKRLLSLAIRPLLVFDGPARPAFKRGRQTYPNSAPLVNIQIKRLLDLLGIPYHDAPGEAEAECALLQREGIVDAVLSEDVDTLMFGCRLTLRNWKSEDVRRGKPPTHVSMYDAAKTQDSGAGLTPQGMLLVALMSGGDYNPAGLVGCGPKVACEAARAGYGESLCKLSASDTEGIKAWRDGLVHELRTNESKFFKTKHKALQISENFPDRAVWTSYRNPIVSPTVQLEGLKQRLDWTRKIDIPNLREYVRHTFDWQFRSQAIKLIRIISEAQVVNQLILSERGPQMGEHPVVESATRTIESVCGRRIDMSTDGKPELRVTYVPMNCAPLNLEAEDSGSEVNVLVETSSETGSVEEGDRAPRTENNRKRAKSTWDPHKPQTMWICEVIVRRAVPGHVQAWEEEQRKEVELAKEKEKSRAAKQAEKTRKTRGGMEAGAMRQYMGVTKSGSSKLQAAPKTKKGYSSHEHEDDLAALDALLYSSQGAATTKVISTTTTTKPSGRGKSKPGPKSPQPVRRSSRKPAGASRQQAAGPGKGVAPPPDSITPWTLSKRRSGTFDLPGLPPPSGYAVETAVGGGEPVRGGAVPSPDEIQRRPRRSSDVAGLLLSSSLPPTPGRQRPPGRGHEDADRETVDLTEQGGQQPQEGASLQLSAKAVIVEPISTIEDDDEDGPWDNQRSTKRSVMLRDSLEGRWKDSTECTVGETERGVRGAPQRAWTALQFSILWTILVCLGWGLSFVNRWIAYGSARHVDLTKEVVVITGGASGLGLLLAEIFAGKGARVAVLDVSDVKRQGEGRGELRGYRCDVTNRKEVEMARERIEEDLGTPTILINNAAIVYGKSVLELSAEEAERTLQVNLLAHFHTVHTFLPGMIQQKAGTIVTISSSLAYTGCDYSSTKAALLAFHASLKAELSSSSSPSSSSSSNIKTVLVIPGQMSTSMFAGIRTPSNFFAPVVEPIEMAKSIVQAVERGKNDEIALPLYARWIPLLGVLPVGIQRVMRTVVGLDRAMEGFDPVIASKGGKKIE